MSEKTIEHSNVYLLRDGQVCLGLKKQHHEKSFGVGKYNGFGGKIEPGETPEQAAIRECREESLVTPEELSLRAVIHFVDDKNIDHGMYAFTCEKFLGEPTETSEMDPKWFDFDALPDNMWSNDKEWMPKILAGKVFTAEVVLSNTGERGEGKDKTESINFNYVDKL